MNRLLTIVDSKYQRLEYIETHTTSESTGSFLDTLYTPTLNTQVRVKFMPLKYGNTFSLAGYFGARQDHYRFACITFSNGTTFTFAVTNNTWSNNRTTLAINQIYDCIAENGKQIINGTEYNETIVEDWGNCGHFLLGKIVTPEKTICSNGRYYSCQIWESGVLVRNMIPVMRKSDNEIGMLDLVEGKFYGNAGTGKFTANLDTMYALIQGNPTVQDGRVSGFTSSNYLKIGQIPTVQNRLERQVKIKTSNTTGSTQTIISTGGYAGIRINDGNQIGTIVYINGSYSNLTLNTVLNRNTEYIYKDVFENGTLTIYLYNYQMVLLETKSASIGFDENTNYNLGQSSGRIFTGTIDLNRSYIKIDDTKYKLQAVVGYTVVGSPTITDGVVSGFSASDYLQTEKTLSGVNVSQLNFYTKVIVPSIQTYNQIFICYWTTSLNGLMITSSLKLRWVIARTLAGNDTVIASSINITEGDILLVKAFYDNINNQFVLQASKDNGINWIENRLTLSPNTISTITTNIRIGNTGNSTYNRTFNGSIDLSQTYIKINNKLWFNGLEA